MRTLEKGTPYLCNASKGAEGRKGDNQGKKIKEGEKREEVRGAKEESKGSNRWGK